MARDEKPLVRRDVLKKCGVTIGAGAVLAGCTGNSQSGGDNSSDNQSGSGSSGDNQSESGSSSGNRSNGSSNNSQSSNNGSSSGSSGSGPSLSITLATTQPPENITVKALKKHFINPLKNKSNGRITIDLKAASLGGTEDNLDATQAGTVDMVIESPIALAQSFSSEYTFTGDPFVVKNMEHYKKIQKQYLLPEDGLNGVLLDTGLRLSDSFRVGFRGTNSNSAVKTPDDVQGLKLRLPQYDTWNTIWSEIGAQPTPVAYDELYSALQTGVADASEGPISQFMAKSLYNVQDYFSSTNHVLSVKHFIFNQSFYDGMDQSNKKMIESTISEATPKMSQQIRDNQQQLFKQAGQKGTNLVKQDAVKRDQFAEQARPALEKLSKNQWAVSLSDIRDLE